MDELVPGWPHPTEPSARLDWHLLDEGAPDETPVIEPSPDARRPRRRRRPSRGVQVLTVALVLALAGGGVAYAAKGPSGPSYRTATVGSADVSQTLQATGVISPMNQAKASFPVAGRVVSVATAVGQQVTAGQTLASLDTTSLRQADDSARSAVAADQARLDADLAAQAAGVPSTAGGGSSAGGAGGTGDAGGSATGTVTTAGVLLPATRVLPTAFLVATRSGPAGAAGTSSVTVAQRTLLADQHAADLALQAARADLTAARSVCRSVTGGVDPALYVDPTSAVSPAARTGASTTGSGSGSTPSTTGTGSTGRGNSGSGSGTKGSVAACSTALTKVLSDESAVSGDQQQVSAAASALDVAVGQALAVAPRSGGSGGGGGSASAGATGSRSAGPSTTKPSRSPSSAGTSRSAGSRSASGSGSGATGKSRGATSSGSSGKAGGALVTSTQVAADQATVDAAEARAQTADLALEQADLVSPLTGTVGQVNVQPGSSVSAASTTPAFVILGPGADEAVIDVPSTSIGSVQLNQAATVLPDGQATTVPGTVVAIGLLPTTSTGTGSSSASSTPTYPVSVALSGPNQTPFAGSGASVDVIVATAKSALSVPTSAVRTVGGNHVVTVLRGGKANTVPVQVGAIGPTRTQVLSGLAAGDRVVLADTSLPLPTSSSSIRGLTGGGFSGAGATGGAGARAGAGTRTG